MSDIFKDWSFGGQLKTMRLSREMPLRHAATLAGVDPGNLSKYERSELDPPRKISLIDKMTAHLKPSESERNMLISAAFSFQLGKLKESFNR